PASRQTRQSFDTPFGSRCGGTRRKGRTLTNPPSSPKRSGRKRQAQRMNSRLIDLNSSVPARSIHSKATISRETICAPAWRMRCSASSLSEARRELTASSTTNTWLPCASRSSTVCITQTWVSQPQITNCLRSSPGRLNSSPSAAEENSIFSRMDSAATPSRRTEAVGPRPLLYCSVSSTGTSTRRAICCSQAVCSIMLALSRMAGSRRSWMSMINRVDSVALIRMSGDPCGSGFGRADESRRVDTRIVEADVPVRVRPDGATGGTDLAEDFGTTELLDDLHIDLREVTEHADQPLAMVDEHRLAIEEVVAGENHLAGGRRLDRCAGLGGEIQPRMRIAFFTVEEAAQAER